MIYSKNFLSYMIELEGKVPYVYKDKVGYKTVGIGCRVYNADFDHYSKSKPMPDGIINSLFWKRAQEYIDSVTAAIKVPLLDYQIDALIAMSFNIGSAGFKNSTLVKKINSGVKDSSLTPYFEAWRFSTNQTTKVKSEDSVLLKRRKMEYHLFTTGEYLGYDMKPLSFSKKNNPPKSV